MSTPANSQPQPEGPEPSSTDIKLIGFDWPADTHWSGERIGFDSLDCVVIEIDGPDDTPRRPCP
jgi:hypothetical protein